MAKNNNIIEEIQELIQQIKNEYKEGVDFKFEIKGKGKYCHWVSVISPQLKKVLREKFSIAIQVKFLDYHRRDSQGNWFTYRVEEPDLLLVMEEGEMKNKTENCKQCNKLVAEKEGWIRQWDGRKKPGEPTPNIIAYFHPHCAKRYFANKEQPNQNDNARIKEKLLRNLDKLCLDPMGELANAELLKQKGVEKNYNSDNFENAHDNSKPSYDIYKKFLKEVHEVEIEGEKIWLSDYSATSVGSFNYQEVKEALMQEIKQNPVEWEIANYLDESSWKCDGGQLIIRNKKDGRRHWRAGFYNFWENRYEKRKEWDQIEATLRGCKPLLNNQLTPTDKNQLLQYFLTYHITKITLNNGKLVVEYDNSNLAQKVDNSELEKYKGLIQNLPNHSISLSDLKETNSNPQNSTKNPNNHQLAIGLAIGAGAVALTGIVIYFWNRKKKVN